MRLKKHMVTEQLEFNGGQLLPGWGRERYRLQGEHIVAFIGPFQPDPQAISFPPQSEPLRGKRMLHLLVEHRCGDVEKARLQQQLLLNIMKDKLNHRLKGDVIQRWRQDLCRNAAHITASAIRLTPSATIIYLAVNIERSSPPSAVWGLEDGSIDVHELAQAVMDQYVLETELSRQPAD